VGANEVIHSRNQAVFIDESADPIRPIESELGVDALPGLTTAAAFDELAFVI